MTVRRWGVRAASPSRVPAGEGGNPLPGPPPLVSPLLCLAQDRAEDHREPSANKNPKAGRGAQIQASGDPRDLSTLDQPCACAGIPSAFRMGAPKEKGRLRKSGGHQGGLKEKRGYWGTGGLKPASTLGKEQEPQRGKKS